MSASALVAAPALWLAHFGAVYGLASLACAAAARAGFAAAPAIFWGTALLTAAAVALAGAGAVRSVRTLRRGGADEQAAFVSRTALLLYALAALAMVWVALPALLLPGCS